MADAEVDDRPRAVNTKTELLEPAKQHKLPPRPARDGSMRSIPNPPDRKPANVDSGANDDLPQPFDAKSLERPKKRARSPSPQPSDPHLPRKPKRPGQRARITESEREAIRQRAVERERQAQGEQNPQAQRAHIDDVVRSHYNSVPERGREWRKTASTIRGLRSFNNWVKSCIIQKFSPDEDPDGGRGHDR